MSHCPHRVSWVALIVTWRALVVDRQPPVACAAHACENQPYLCKSFLLALIKSRMLAEPQAEPGLTLSHPPRILPGSRSCAGAPRLPRAPTIFGTTAACRCCRRTRRRSTAHAQMRRVRLGWAAMWCGAQHQGGGSMHSMSMGRRRRHCNPASLIYLHLPGLHQYAINAFPVVVQLIIHPLGTYPCLLQCTRGWRCTTMPSRAGTSLSSRCCAARP